MTITLEQAEQIFILSQSQGIDTLVELQSRELTQQELQQLRRDRKTSWDEFVEAAGIMKGMRWVSFAHILAEAKGVIKKNSEACDPR